MGAFSYEATVAYLQSTDCTCRPHSAVPPRHLPKSDSNSSSQSRLPSYLRAWLNLCNRIPTRIPKPSRCRPSCSRPTRTIRCRDSKSPRTCRSDDVCFRTAHRSLAVRGVARRRGLRLGRRDQSDAGGEARAVGRTRSAPPTAYAGLDRLSPRAAAISVDRSGGRIAGLRLADGDARSDGVRFRRRDDSGRSPPDSHARRLASLGRRPSDARQISPTNPQRRGLVVRASAAGDS